MNKLANSASLYLRQHANNPVDWYPWGKEALARAKKENKPILVSIGYSTCYWCHVMERDVFEKPEIAAVMNKHLINIKVDREERPDIDEIYMSARQIISRQGGWPNNVFLTPDLQPFYAGGTFASDNRYGSPGFAEVVEMISQSWQMKKDEVNEAADSVTQRMTAMLSAKKYKPTAITADTVNTLAKHLSTIHDSALGGFYQAPKFPHEAYLLFLIDYYKVTKDQKILDIVIRSLDKMAAGGIFDHVGGGFHRYATDADWRVPHFEKMLYNQALMARVYLEAYTITDESYYEHIARSTLDFVASEMQGNRGQFYSAYDAETAGVEGEYYVWNEPELRDILTPGAYDFLMEYYSLEDLPHFEGHKHPDGKVLFAKKPIDVAAVEGEQTYDDLQQQLNKVLGKLLTEREKRTKPVLDNKVIAAWHGMMMTAFARASDVLEDRRYQQIALDAAEFVRDEMVSDNFTLARIWTDGTTSTDAFLDDYSNVVQGSLAVAQATGDKTWAKFAIDLINRADDLYYDGPPNRPKTGGFFYTRDSKDLIVKLKTADDSAIPSANAVMVQALVDMDGVTKNTEWEHEVWRERAQETISAFSNQIVTSPEYYVHMLHAHLRLSEKKFVKNKGLDKVSAKSNVISESLQKRATSSANYVKVEADWNVKKPQPGKDAVLYVTIKIAADWHINTNPAPLDFLIPTSVDVRGDELVEVINVSYPEANGNISTINGDIMETYEDKITIPVTLSLKKWAKPGDFVTLNIMTTVQACDHATCLEPATQIIEMPLIVAENG